MEENRIQRPEDGELALSLRDVHISYRVVRPISVGEILGRKQQKSRYFHAVKGVSVDIRKGEILGMIGKNGSGKSTLLRAIAGIYSPDSGSIEAYGHSVGLMAIGVGFNNDLSGRDNIFLSGMLMGFSKQEIQERFDEIVDFAKLRDFIDEPVRSYSSGMHSKLAFSITANMEPDIMLVDETLSVGDTNFKRKSMKKMKQLIRSDDRTVLIVSHSFNVLEELCARTVWMDDGIIRSVGPTKQILEEYKANSEDDEEG
jgi:ABC-type polysaccharide/polyol phosphate transport system, ATPase component